MFQRRCLKLFLAVAWIGCAEPAPELTYRGPEVRLEPSPELLATAITVPTGGYELRRDGIEEDGDQLRVRYTLEEPAPTEVVTQAWSELRDDVAVPVGIRRVQVLVARRLRGAHYVVAPRHELAAVLDR